MICYGGYMGSCWRIKDINYGGCWISENKNCIFWDVDSMRDRIRVKMIFKLFEIKFEWLLKNLFEFLRNMRW